MTFQEIDNIVNHETTKKYKVKFSDETKKVLRLWRNGTYGVCVLGKHKKVYGHQLSNSYDHYGDWVSLKLVEH
jgi:hypothetical protein